MAYEGNCRLGDLFKSRREKGRAGLPLLSVTMNDGLVGREDLERKQETNLAPEDHLLVKSGDIAYNMMRMWQGAFGLANKVGLVSPAYVVLEPKVDIDPIYAKYLLKTHWMMHRLWAFSYGITKDRLRLYFDDFRKIPVSVPGIQSQIVVAKILSIIEHAISVQKKLVSSDEKVKAYLLKNLVCRPQGMRPQKAGWICCSFDEVFKVANSRKSQVDQSCYQQNGSFPVVDQGKSLIAGYVDDVTPLPPGATVFGDHTRTIKWIDFHFCVGADGVQVLRAREHVAPKFAHHLLCTINIKSLGYARHMKSIKEAAYWMPRERRDQVEISNIIDVADELVKNSRQQLDALSLMRDGLIQKLIPSAVESVVSTGLVL